MTRPPWITPPLEESLPLFAAARRTDPPTSQAAAANASSFVESHETRILRALAVSFGGQSRIADRCAAMGHPLTPQQVGRRMKKLALQGMCELTTIKDRNANGLLEQTYRLTQAGELVAMLKRAGS